MDKVYVILIIDGIVKAVSDFAIEEREAAENTFRYHYHSQLGKDPDADPRIDEILQTGYLELDAHSTIQIITEIS